MATDYKKNIKDYLDALVHSNKTPGVQYVLYKNGVLELSHAAGYADFENKKPITEDTIFNACSITKTFTSLAIMQLAAQDKLRLDENAAFYSGYLTAEKNITIRQLLSHTSGIANPIPLKWVYLQNEPFDEKNFIQSILTTQLKYKTTPKKKFAYSNINYLLLGDIIEKVSGLQYTDYIKQNIIALIKTPNNKLSFTVDDDKNYAAGYQKKWSLLNALLGFMIDKKKMMRPSVNKSWLKFNYYYISGKAYGGLISNANSLAAFINTMFENDSHLLNNELKEELFTKQHLINNQTIPMTLGWFIGNVNGTAYYTHAGGGGGYYCEMRYYPKQKITSVIMFNRTGISDERILDKIEGNFISQM